MTLQKIGVDQPFWQRMSKVSFLQRLSRVVSRFNKRSWIASGITLGVLGLLVLAFIGGKALHRHLRNRPPHGVYVVSADGIRRHNDYSPYRYERFFGEKITYEQWKRLPRGVAVVPKTGTDAYVISLTSWPPRTKEGTWGIWVTIESLMRQTVKPDRIILWLAEEEYPEGTKTLPQTLIDLQARGLEIRWTKKNRRALTKLLPALEANIPANIITVDDDICYAPDWLERFQKSYRKNPGALHAVVARYMPVRDGQMCPFGYGSDHHVVPGIYDQFWFPEGFAGLLYPYDPTGRTCYGLDKQVLRDAPRYVASADDLWWYVCRVLAGTPFHLLGVARKEVVRFISLPQPLQTLNCTGGQNDVVMRRLLKDFPDFAAKLEADTSKPQCLKPQGVYVEKIHTPWWRRFFNWLRGIGPEGRHIDFDPKRFLKFFGPKVSYEQWRRLPRGVAANPKTGTDAYVISLTSWPARTQKGTPGIWLTIESLMRQTVKPDRIILWLTEEEYPEGTKTLPQTLIDLQARGLEIRWTKKNRRALTKLLPALDANIPANIITVDDDRIYNACWLERFRDARRKHPGILLGIAARYIPIETGQMRPFGWSGDFFTTPGSYDARCFPEGFAGVLYPYDPTGKTCYGLDHRTVTQVPDYVASADDLWWYMGRVLAGTSFRLLGHTIEASLKGVELSEPLGPHNVGSGGNDHTLRLLLKDFPDFAAKLGVDMSKPQCVPPAA